IQDMANAVRQIRTAQQKALRILRHDRFLSDANWHNVEESTNIVNPYVEMHVKAKEQDVDMTAVPSLLEDFGAEGDGPNDLSNEPSNDEIKEMTEEARLRLLKALKVSCWRQYEQGILTKDAVQILVDVLESTEDRKFQMVHTRDFERYWEIDGFFVYLRRKVLPYSSGSFEDEEHPLPKEPWRHCYHRLACSFFFSTLIYIVIIGNMIPVAWETYYIVTYHHFSQDEHIIFFTVNLVFTIIYLLEFGIKVIGIGFGEYLSSRWNVADCIILIISFVESILSGTYLEEAIATADSAGMTPAKSMQEADFLKFVRFIRLARVTRILRFFKPLLPLIMRYLNNQVNKRIFLGYDIGKGFVSALDDVQKFLPQMVDHPRVLLKFKWNLENQRVEVVRKMGLLQKDHPEIAIAVKTRHAARAVLNTMKDSLLELKEDGLVDEKEYNALHEEIEQKMKHLWDSPAYMKTSSAELSLANVAWMAMSSGSKELYEFIHKQATLITYARGDIMCDVYDKPNGILVIISGLIKVHYDPTFEMITEREDYGAIPNMEIFQDLSFENEMDDYFSTGTVIGELGVVTDQPRAARVTCETGVIAYHIPQSVMKTAITSFDDPYDSLEARIWRTCGMRLAASLLPAESAFSSWTMDKVKTYLELSAVPIGEKYDELLIPDFVADVVVIYGQVCNYENMDEVYTAPCLIPQTCYHIKNKPGTSVPARILIIASQDVEHLAEEDDDHHHSHTKFGVSSGGSDMTLHRVILAGTKVTSLTEAEALGIHLQRQSRAVNFGVVSNKPEASKATVNK
ncbi:Sodium/hydrogen exchanger 10, partial [Orchesella cincta]